MRRYFLMLLFINFISQSCNNKDGVFDRRIVDGNIVESKFISDTLIDGVAKYLDSQEMVIARITYSRGVKNGVAINYFGNGNIKDSMYFNDGLPNGPSFLFDSSGNIKISKYNYYGLSVGPYAYYESGKIYKYIFTDFENNVTLKCEYDSNLISSMTYDNQPIFTEAIDSRRKSVIKLFYYLPSPPHLNITYKIGLENNQRESKYESLVLTNKPFLDTVLQRPDSGWHYFLSAHLESLNSGINKIYFHELRADSTFMQQ